MSAILHAELDVSLSAAPDAIEFSGLIRDSGVELSSIYLDCVFGQARTGRIGEGTLQAIEAVALRLSQMVAAQRAGM